jgi:hypothetical protein
MAMGGDNLYNSGTLRANYDRSPVIGNSSFAADGALEALMLARWSYPALLLSILVIVLVSAQAQVRTTGQISGTAVDPSNAVVAGATITARDTSTGLSQTATTNSSGQYAFPSLQPGSYEVTAAAAGFATAVYSDVVIEAGRTKDLAIHMTIGQQNQSVDVSAQGAVLETTTNTLASAIDPERVQNLPLAGRDILPMAQLVPGTQVGGDERFTTYNSLPNGAVNITIDGTSGSHGWPNLVMPR